MHWGEEKRFKTTTTQRQYGHAIIDVGADLVLGNHSHVVGEIEKYNGKYIVYSLGNFCFGGNSNPEDKDAFIFQADLCNRRKRRISDGGIDIVPCSTSSVSSTNNYQPTPLTGERAAEVLTKIAKYASVSAEDIVWMDGYYTMLASGT